MGLFDKLKNEFIDIIEWVDATQDTIVWKFPRYQNEIKMNAKLTVRESQVALFLNEGKFLSEIENSLKSDFTINGSDQIISKVEKKRYGVITLFAKIANYNENVDP